MQNRNQDVCRRLALVLGCRYHRHQVERRHRIQMLVALPMVPIDYCQALRFVSTIWRAKFYQRVLNIVLAYRRCRNSMDCIQRHWQGWLASSLPSLRVVVSPILLAVSFCLPLLIYSPLAPCSSGADFAQFDVHGTSFSLGVTSA